MGVNCLRPDPDITHKGHYLDPYIPGGGSQEKWSSQLAHIRCGTQKGGQNERFTHNMGSLSQMYTQTVELCVEWYLFLNSHKGYVNSSYRSIQNANFRRFSKKVPVL